MSERESLRTSLRQRLAPHLVTVHGTWRGRGTTRLIWRSAEWREGRPNVQARFKRRNPVDHKLLRVGRVEGWW